MDKRDGQRDGGWMGEWMEPARPGRAPWPQGEKTAHTVEARCPAHQHWTSLAPLNSTVKPKPRVQDARPLLPATRGTHHTYTRWPAPLLP